MKISRILLTLAIVVSLFFSGCNSGTISEETNGIYSHSFIRYSDIENDSGVYAYEYGNDYIRIQFKSGAIYLYTYDSTGAANIEKMKVLADKCDGLNTFINKEVKYLYAKKEN